MKQIPNFIKPKYLELIYLGEYYRWCASKPCNAVGNRSPLNGKQYTISSVFAIDHKAAKAAQIASSKVYFKAASQLRKDYTK